ncbi:hypothetical protein [Paenibacillus silviterrae]|uniref:hypothetical protein n=1 Tax=Paenibacillus silviterrae TaxID=3242194 RepID=UPI0032B21561
MNKVMPHGRNNGASRPLPSLGTAEDVKAGDRNVVTIKRIGINGEGVGYYKRRPRSLTALCLKKW